MPLLTIETIIENPWNAIRYELPRRPTQLLLALAHYAVDYCRISTDLSSLFDVPRRNGSWWTKSEIPSVEFCRKYSALGKAAEDRSRESEALCLKLYALEIDDIEI